MLYSNTILLFYSLIRSDFMQHFVLFDPLFLSSFPVLFAWMLGESVCSAVMVVACSSLRIYIYNGHCIGRSLGSHRIEVWPS
uniref:Uncharacterized protein n=1 Tax=Picea glauca TaxID=3330 RepID=A0A124GNC2_PICGL|nr:hypothetical protein ABT39_MTgene5381 [Picea glauca]QHR86400.1 hypothetical protein Q903MT_gene399 [Picea sitchensis]